MQVVSAIPRKWLFFFLNIWEGWQKVPRLDHGTKAKLELYHNHREVIPGFQGRTKFCG